MGGVVSSETCLPGIGTSVKAPGGIVCVLSGQHYKLETWTAEKVLPVLTLVMDRVVSPAEKLLSTRTIHCSESGSKYMDRSLGW